MPFDYDEIEVFVDGRAKAQKNDLWGRLINHWGYIDNHGKIIIPFEYDLIEEFVNDKAKAKFNGKWGYLDNQGNILVPFEYDAITCFQGGVIAFKDHTFRLIPLNVDAEEIESSVVSIAKFGVFIRISSSFNGLLHISSINKAGKSISNFMKGNKVKVYIDSINTELKRASLTLLPPKPHLEVKKNDNINLDSYLIGDTYDGTITNIKPFGLFVKLQRNLTALLHISELKKHHKDISSFNVNDQINVKILTVDKEKERIALTL